jgi:hypothetical protein
MRRKLLGAAAATTAIAAFGGAGLAAADGDGAIVIKGDDCTIGISEETAFVTFDQQRVLTPSGNRTLVCHGWYDPANTQNPPGPDVTETVVVKHLLCGVRDADGGGVQQGNLQDAHSVLTKSGRVNYTCHFKQNKPV